jgi:hypothetical protein
MFCFETRQSTVRIGHSFSPRIYFGGKNLKDFSLHQQPHTLSHTMFQYQKRPGGLKKQLQRSHNPLDPSTKADSKLWNLDPPPSHAAYLWKQAPQSPDTRAKLLSQLSVRFN